MEISKNAIIKIVGLLVIYVGFNSSYNLILMDKFSVGISIGFGCAVAVFGVIIFLSEKLKVVNFSLGKDIKLALTIEEAKKIDEKLDEKIQVAEEKIDNLEIVNQFTAKAVTAPYDNNSLLELKKLSENTSFPSQFEAAMVYKSVCENYNYTGFPPVNYSTAPNIFSTNPTNILEIDKSYNNADIHEKKEIIGHLWNTSSFTLKERLEFFVNKMKDEVHNEVLSYLGTFFSKGTGFECNPLDKGKIIDWWEENQDKYE